MRKLPVPRAPARGAVVLRAVQAALQQATSSGGRYIATLAGTIENEVS
jgi:hypothetical protein